MLDQLNSMQENLEKAKSPDIKLGIHRLEVCLRNFMLFNNVLFLKFCLSNGFKSSFGHVLNTVFNDITCITYCKQCYFQIERIRFILSSYLRKRLQKVLVYKNDNQLNLMLFEMLIYLRLNIFVPICLILKIKKNYRS